MTREELINRFPKASEAFIRANANNQDSRPQEMPKLERSARNGTLATPPRQERVSGRISVRVKNFSRRLYDPDNIAAKYGIDCLRYAKLIRDDTAADIDLTISQEKVKTKEEERTEIEIDL